MSRREVAEYGFWKSPITSDLVAGESIRIAEPLIEGDTVYWLEARPTERGRSALVRLGPDGPATDVLPRPWNVRTAVHEYGGGAYTVSRGTVYFSEARSHRLYRIESGRGPEPLTPPGKRRYADFAVDRHRSRLVSVREDHTVPDREAVQSVVAVDLGGGRPAERVLLSGADFYSNPRISPDGRCISWLEWHHPNMPWDGTELWLGMFDAGGAIRDEVRIAGGPRESVFQPQWSPDGRLHFVSDRSGFWNLFRHSGQGCTPLHEREAEFGLPQWVFGMSTYGFAEGGRVLSAFCDEGRWKLGLFDERGRLDPIDVPFTQIGAVSVRGRKAAFVAASPTAPPSLVQLDLPTRDRVVLRSSAEVSCEIKGYFSKPRSVSFRSSGGALAHAYYYEPWNPDYEAPVDEKPPLIIRLHGGPTAAASDGLSLTTQFWTSRGFAVADLNYGGSTGFGRAYRERLNGQWGVVDRDDAVAAAKHFVREGVADRDRVIVKGGSAGGFTVLCCLAFCDESAAGASYYGISDLRGLAEETHKFESRYNDTLIGPLPDAEQLYFERSPIAAADRVSTPAVFFQGAADPVVLKGQTETMVAALRKRGIPVAYYLFEGESHGFRRSATIRLALDAELAFYGTVLLRKGIRY